MPPLRRHWIVANAGRSRAATTSNRTERSLWPLAVLITAAVVLLAPATGKAGTASLLPNTTTGTIADFGTTIVPGVPGTIVSGVPGTIADLTLAQAPGQAGAASFSNTGAITINDPESGVTCDITKGTATPYPSNISVSGLTATISDVTVTLTGLTHTFPDDVGVLLVGPGGQNVVLMADTGGDAAVSGVNLTFDDAAAGSLPDADQIVSGTYRPTRGANNGPCFFRFEAPAPAGPYGSALSVFDGTDPNGTWSLYVIDDSRSDAGSIAGGWSLDITTADAGPAALIESALARVEELAAGPDEKVADRAADVQAKLAQAQAKLEGGDAAGALGELEGAAGDLEAMLKDGLLDTSEGEELLDRLAEAGRLLAEEAIAAATQAGGNAEKIAAAEDSRDEGDALREDGRCKDALAKYKDALSKAEGA